MQGDNRPITYAKGVADDIIPSLAAWIEERRDTKGIVRANAILVGLYVTRALQGRYPLERDDYLTKGQVKGAGYRQATEILTEHNEFRPPPKEAGRTSRGTQDHAISLVKLIDNHPRSSDIRSADDEDRANIAWLLQEWFVEQMRREYFNKQRLRAEVSHERPIRHAVAALLAAGSDRGGNAAGAVAQHLVGATLALRFPGAHVNNESYTTADQQTSRAGDFEIGDTAIHVTVRPTQALLSQRCQHNIDNGFRPLVLVPDNRVAAARQLAEVAGMHDRVCVQSLEDFVGVILESSADYTTQNIRRALRTLLETYNARVEVAESDPSLQVEIPTKL